MQTLSNRQRNHTNRSHRSVKKHPSSGNRPYYHLIGKLTAKQLSPLTRLVVHLDDCTMALPGYWPWIFHLLLRTRVLASSCCCCFDFEKRCVRPLLLTHSLTNEGEKEGRRGIGIGYVELDANWHATLARDISICFEAVWLDGWMVGYLMQISGEREGKGERYSLIRKKRRRLEILFPKDLSIGGE